MKPDEKKQSEIIQAYETWLHAYLNGDVRTYDSYFDNDYRFIGSTNNEEFLNRNDTTSFFKKTAGQLAGKTELRNNVRTVEEIGGLVFITHLFDAYFLNGTEWTYYGRFRFSSTMQKKGKEWKFIYQHFSMPDAKSEEGDTIGYDRVAEENQELREAIRRRTVELESKNRELEIETALEKVRTVALAMKDSADMLGVCHTIAVQLKKLGVKEIRNVQTAIFYESKGTYMNYEFYVKHDKEIITETSYTNHKVHLDFANQMLKGKGETYKTHIDKKALNDWIAYQKTTNVFIDTFLETAPSLTYYWHSLGPVALGISTYAPLSKKELDLFKRFLNVFELAYTRYLDIEQALVQVKEAKIEAALEKVRSRSLAMHRSEELQEVVTTVFERLRDLDIETDAINLDVFSDNIKDAYLWTAVPGHSYSREFHIPYNETVVFKDIYEGMVAGKELHSKVYSREEKDEFLTYVFAHTDFKHIPEERKAMLFATQASTVSVAYAKHIAIVAQRYRDKAFSDDENEILKRFAKVFEQAYTRFLDLKKAEAQGREAKIEAALERVRSASMAMHSSDELENVIRVLTDQLTDLGFEFHTANFITNASMPDWEIWISSPGSNIPPKLFVPYFNHRLFDERNDAVTSGKDILTVVLSPEEKSSFLKYFFAHSTAKNTDEDRIKWVMDQPGMALTTVVMKSFSLSVINYYGKLYTESENEVIKRLAHVFEQSYTRFLDLQKAEAQTREAQIELSLERIRARVTAMKVSSDLLDIVVAMRTEFVALGHEAHYFWHMRWQPDIYEKAMTSGDGSRIGNVMTLPHHIHGDIPLIANWENSNEPTVVYAMDAEAAVDYVVKMINLGDFEQVDSNAPTLDDIRHIGGLTFIMARTTHGEIGYSLPGTVPHPPAEDIATLVRFAAVFDLAYRRFEDLKSSEKQIREAQIELALERVRSKVIGMNHSHELKEISYVFSDQMRHLGVDWQFSYFWLIEEEKDASTFWITWPDNHTSVTAYSLAETDDYTRECLIVWKAGQKMHWNQIPAEGVGHFLETYKQLAHDAGSSAEGVMKEDNFKKGVFYYDAMMKYGSFGICTNRPATEEENKIQCRFAIEFERAYTRFLDLKQAEQLARQAEEDLVQLKIEKQKTEEALHELKETQKQLIQSEKMASLGELTAGIAHEIQNPLNFVNNFSEVSNELLSEMLEEVAKGNYDEVKAIVADVKQNLEKINHHGKRADGIVKGMLQHSRSSSAIKEPTDINKLADEYLRLAYHGLRAKDKSFNAIMKTDYDETIGNINIIPQDIGRVILNLITNAFYVVNEKKNQGLESYEPTVTVKTLKNALPAGGGRDAGVVISVSDNGNGIPPKVLDKIFQPFFTTKPTGQGTGLGLSLSYDIVKAHGGELKVQTDEGRGSEFSIQLPIG